MKTKLIISILLVSLVMVLFGQNVGPKKCKVCGKPFAQCQYRGKHPQKTENDASSKPASQSSSKQSKPTNSKPSTSSQRQTNLSATYSNGVLTCNGVSYKMIHVEGGTFMMGATSEQGSDAWDNEKPAHQVTLSTFSIGETEVTQELWEAVMGSNPSRFKGTKRPVETVSWNDCQSFISKLNAATGSTFRLPTEAEWEFSARGGNSSRGHKYSGSNEPNDVTWYYDNSGRMTHDVATKKANELGLYDMSGNVLEWCSDWYEFYYSNSSQMNPLGPISGKNRMLRGGAWDDSGIYCRVSCRKADNPNWAYSGIGLRLAISDNQLLLFETPQQIEPRYNLNEKFLGDSLAINVTFVDGVLTYNGVSYKMIHVDGGTFLMGGTTEQGAKVSEGERPVHQVTLSSFCIGETEVTQELWQAVMWTNPSCFKGNKRPVELVSWNYCQAFIKKLNVATGRRFRLPTEAEWEFAARGGNSSRGYKYSGSNIIDSVAWYFGNSGYKTHDVAEKQPNELGLYDMSGNVCEWCQDWYGNYIRSFQTNPNGPASGSERVSRGGGWMWGGGGCRSSYRHGETPDEDGISHNQGFRLVLAE